MSYTTEGIISYTLATPSSPDKHRVLPWDRVDRNRKLKRSEARVDIYARVIRESDRFSSPYLGLVVGSRDKGRVLIVHVATGTMQSPIDTLCSPEQVEGYEELAAVLEDEKIPLSVELYMHRPTYVALTISPETPSVTPREPGVMAMKLAGTTMEKIDNMAAAKRILRELDLEHLLADLKPRA
jgi:hypothetical protein